MFDVTGVIDVHALKESATNNAPIKDMIFPFIAISCKYFFRRNDEGDFYSVHDSFRSSGAVRHQPNNGLYRTRLDRDIRFEALKIIKAPGLSC